MAIITDLDRKLERWVEATVIDSATAQRIRRYEAETEHRSDWLVKIALILGALMVGAGVLLFVAAHWDDLAPSQQFALVLSLVAIFHVAGALLHERTPRLAITLHAIGTVALGGGIFLAGQIFNLQEHWPGGIMLWALGAAIAWWLLEDSVQGIFFAVLAPIWLAGEWAVRIEHRRGGEAIIPAFIALLALSYLTARPHRDDGRLRHTLAMLGCIVLIPALGIMIEELGRLRYSYLNQQGGVPRPELAIAWVLAIALPLAVAYWLRGKAALLNAAAAAWLVVLALFNPHELMQEMAIYGWCAVGSMLLVWWGLREVQKRYINLGVAGFAVTVAFFYFSSVMDKLGRSAALIAGGLIFLLGGFELEKLRRKLIRDVSATPEGGLA